MQPKRGRPKEGEESFSKKVYKVATILWRNGYRPFTRHNIIEYFKIQLGEDIDPHKLTSALVYLKSKGLLKCKSRLKWYLTDKKYPDVSSQRYHYMYHPLPRCKDCVWLNFIVDKTIIERKSGRKIKRRVKIVPYVGGEKVYENAEVIREATRSSKKRKDKIMSVSTKRYPVCTCPYSPHYGHIVDIHEGRRECVTVKPYAYEGYLTEEEIYERGLHINPFFPSKYYQLKDGKVVRRE